MDKEVLIRFVEFLEKIFARINSKRLMTFYGFLLFLGFSKSMTELAVYCGLGGFFLTMLLLMRKGDDKVNA